MTGALLVAGAVAVLAGLGAIAYGIPFKEFSVGSTLILSGTIGVCSGLLLFGLAAVVSELKVLRLEDAVRRMTSLPANTFHLRDRGLIREGAIADLVAFDPDTVQDDATYADPHHYARGFSYVWVNGKAVINNNQPTGERPGQPLRHQPRSDN